MGPAWSWCPLGCVHKACGALPSRCAYKEVLVGASVLPDGEGVWAEVRTASALGFGLLQLPGVSALKISLVLFQLQGQGEGQRVPPQPSAASWQAWLEGLDSFTEGSYLWLPGAEGWGRNVWLSKGLQVTLKEGLPQRVVDQVQQRSKQG